MRSYTKQTFRIYWQHVKRHRVLGLVAISGVVFANIASIIVPLFYKEFFDTLVEPISITARYVALVPILFKVLVAYLASWLFWRVGNFSLTYFQAKIMTELANTCFNYLHGHSVNFFNNNFIGSLVKRVGRFYRGFEGIADTFFYSWLPIGTQVSIIIGVLFLRNHWLSLTVFIWVIVYMAVNYAFSRYKFKYDVKKSEMDSVVTGVLADTITNQSNVKLFTGHEREKHLFRTVTMKLQRLRILTWNLDQIFEAIQVFLIIFLEVGTFYLALRLWRQGIVTVGDFVLIQAYLMEIFHRLWDFGKVIRRYYEHLAEANEMTEILVTPHEITDTKSAKPLVVPKGEIVFDGVSFSYHKTRRVITNFSLTIKPNERIALVGHSGAGKSTIVNLLLRNHDLGHGNIKIDNQNIQSVTLESLWQNIGLVSQDPILFHRTLRENIRYGKPKATDGEVERAAKLAHSHEFIMEMPEGYDTYVGERGVKLSGGERQRIAIARAILKNAPILVLDEATSSLDSESEHLIQEALQVLMKNKTVIVIAHRLSTIMKMDRIVVLQEGQIIEQGSHQQLIRKKKGVYKALWERQVGGFIE